MSDLDIQLADRVRTFLQRTGLTQRDVAKAIHCDPGNFNAFLSGAKTLSTAKTARLWQLMRLNKAQLVEKFAEPKSESRITHFQSLGQEMRLADTGGWVPGRTSDPNDLNEGIEVKSASNLEDADDELSRVLAQLNGLHQKAIDILDAYVAKKARPNKAGPTEPARKINSNADSSRPGSRRPLIGD